MEIDDFKMTCDSVSFMINKDAIGRLVEIELINRGHMSIDS